VYVAASVVTGSPVLLYIKTGPDVMSGPAMILDVSRHRGQGLVP
jgi:hypothetical protein